MNTPEMKQRRTRAAVGRIVTTLQSTGEDRRLEAIQGVTLLTLDCRDSFLGRSVHVHRRWLAGLAAILIALPAAAEHPKGLVFENAWVRAMPPFQTVSAGYLTVTNRSDTAVAIVAASSNVAKRVELHATRMVDGMMRMEPVDALALAPGEQVEFSPGGMHLMMLDVAFPLVVGDDVQLCLQLASGEKACTNAEVRKEGEAAAAGDHQQHPSQ
jgi:copper(I)-binding protein